jgi:hypothetical protein
MHATSSSALPGLLRRKRRSLPLERFEVDESGHAVSTVPIPGSAFSRARGLDAGLPGARKERTVSFGIVALIVVAGWCLLSVVVSVTVGGMAKRRDSLGAVAMRPVRRASPPDRGRLAS